MYNEKNRDNFFLPGLSMMTFAAAFTIVEERNCPIYRRGENLVLTDKAVSLPMGKPACMILIRELTGLLFELLPYVADGFAARKESLFTCGGCTGLIKYRIVEMPDTRAEDVEQDGAVMSGLIEAVSPAELLQIFHMHQKTGKLLLETPGGAARVTFREGALIAARFGELDNQEAIYALLQEREGSFRFIPGLPSSLMQAREIGDFMMILMEGLKRLDEKSQDG